MNKQVEELVHEQCQERIQGIFEWVEYGAAPDKAIEAGIVSLLKGDIVLAKEQWQALKAKEGKKE